MTYNQAIEYLYAIAPPFHEVGAKAYKPGLDTMRRLMAEISKSKTVNCQLSTVNYPVVHVAGTNGKGSTSHLIAAALAAAGYKVGLYTSPHLVSFCERVRVIEAKKPRLIPEYYVAQFVESYQSLFEQLQPSFFEITTAMAFTWLAEQKVDIAVIEVGLGGLLDATNIVQPVLSVITNIGLDHTDLLGHTLAEIAGQKAGIMKPGVPCVIGETNEETAPVFISRARDCGILGEGLETTDCRIWFADQCGFLRKQRLRFASDCELHGDYQQKNLQTAYVALMALRNCELSTINYQLSTINCQLSTVNYQLSTINYQLSTNAIAEGFANVVTYTGLCGRWETLCEHPLTICDTGHNSHGVATYVEQLKRITNQTPALRRLRIVFGMVADKDVDEVLRLLPTDATYYFTQPDSHRALSADELRKRWLAIHPNATDCRSFDRIADALRQAQNEAGADDCIFIGGSNYVVGEVLKLQSANLG